MSLRTKRGYVGGMVEDILPEVNNHFDWEYVRDHYDESPEGKAMGIHFVESWEDEEPVETIILGVAEGPRVVIVDELDDRWEYLGTAVTYQEYGARILDPEDDMTPSAARYQEGGVDIIPSEGESRTRVWYVISELMTIVMNTLEYKAGVREDPPNEG